MDFGWRTCIYGVISIILLCIITDIIGNYSEKMEEALSMNMIFTPLAIILTAILEGCHYIIKQMYIKYKQKA